MNNFFDDSPTVVNNCNEGKCSCCGECCTAFIPMTKAEALKLYELVQSRGLKENVWINGKDQHIFCALLNEKTRRCEAYPLPGEKDMRPKVCRLFKCCQSSKVMIDNRKRFSKDAFFNRSDDEMSYEHMISTHSLLFGNVDWDKQFILGMCSNYSAGDLSKARACYDKLSSIFITVDFDANKNNL